MVVLERSLLLLNMGGRLMLTELRADPFFCGIYTFLLLIRMLCA